MNVTVLIDNNPHPELDLLTEHGLSIYFEADGLKWLYDSGASENFHLNAQKLGIDIADIDFLVVSHGHADHSGGLEHFLNVNSKARIIMSSQILGKSFYSYRRKYKKDISTNTSLIDKYKNRFTLVNENMQLSTNVALICKIPQKYTAPKGNNKLTVSDLENEKPDNFNHEVVLTVTTENGVVVFSGCSHNGVLNILEASSDYFNHSKISACIGGTHLIDSDATNIYESDEEIKEIGKSILSQYPEMQLITGHCTGNNAYKKLASILEGNLKVFHTGTVLSV